VFGFIAAADVTHVLDMAIFPGLKSALGGGCRTKPLKQWLLLVAMVSFAHWSGLAGQRKAANDC
jgi:hypothetical protein